MSNNYYAQGPPSSSPFYAGQHHQGPPPPQQQQQQQYGGQATSPVSSYSASPPQQQPPPLRPHTAAPYAGQGYGPPPTTGPPAGYYQQAPAAQVPAPPPPAAPYRQQQQQQQQQHQPRPDFSPPLQPAQPLQPRQDYGAPASPAAFSPDLPRIIADTHGLPPDVVQRLAEDLMRSIQFSNLAGQGPPLPASVPQLSQPSAPYGSHGPPRKGGTPAAAAAPAPPPPQQYHHQQQQPRAPPPHQQIPGAFPSYAPGPPPPGQQESAPAPAPPHHHQQQRPSQSQPYGPPPGQQSYFPPQPAGPPAVGPPPHSKIPVPAQQLHDEGLGRKGSHRTSKSNASGFSYSSTPATSTTSGPAGKSKIPMDDATGAAVLFDFWGDLVDKEPGREPRPREKLVNLLRDIANYMIKERLVKDSIVITPEKMVDFYTTNQIEGKDGEPLDWKLFFTGRSYSSLSSIYRALNCEHFFVPPASDRKPCIPALTPRGFETWMFTQLMSSPSREAARLQKIVSNWAVPESRESRRYPKLIPRRCFPEKEDLIIRDGWWRVWEEFPPDFDEESEEETLTLPAPGGHPYGPPMTPPEGAEAAYGPPPTHGRGKKGMPYEDEEEEEPRRHRKGSRSKAPAGPPTRKGYGSESGGGNPEWRGEGNPRPTLGGPEDMKPPVRGQAPPARPHTSHGHHPSTDDTDKPRSSRQRDRSEYRHRHQSRHRSRHRRASPSPDDGEWHSGSSGVSARTPGSGDMAPPEAIAPAPGTAPAPAPAPGPRDKRGEEAARVEREQRELFKRFGNDRHGGLDGADPYEFEEYNRLARERDRERDDRRVAEYAYQDEFERDLRRGAGGSAPAPPPAGGGSGRSHHGGGGGGRWEGERERGYRRP